MLFRIRIPKKYSVLILNSEDSTIQLNKYIHVYRCILAYLKVMSIFAYSVYLYLTQFYFDISLIYIWTVISLSSKNRITKFISVRKLSLVVSWKPWMLNVKSTGFEKFNLLNYKLLGLNCKSKSEHIIHSFYNVFVFRIQYSCIFAIKLAVPFPCLGRVCFNNTNHYIFHYASKFLPLCSARIESLNHALTINGHIFPLENILRFCQCVW